MGFTSKQKEKLTKKIKSLLEEDQWKGETVFTTAFYSSLMTRDSTERTEFECQALKMFVERLEDQITTLTEQIDAGKRDTTEQQRLEGIKNTRQNELDTAANNLKEHIKTFKEKVKFITKLGQDLTTYDETLVQKEENVLEHEVFMNQFTEEMEKSFEYLNERTDIVVETTEEMEIDEEGEKPVTEEEVIEKPDAEELKESVLEKVLLE